LNSAFRPSLFFAAPANTIFKPRADFVGGDASLFRSHPSLVELPE
jgi:hypothetical protein